MPESSSTLEVHRHQCEVRQVLQWRQTKGRPFVTDYFIKVEKSRGASCRAELERVCKVQWIKGNRGGRGDWRE